MTLRQTDDHSATRQVNGGYSVSHTHGSKLLVQLLLHFSVSVQKYGGPAVSCDAKVDCNKNHIFLGFKNIFNDY